MFDVFYIGNKPNLFVHECAVESIEQAQQQSRTGYFWMVSYLVDYTGFDFLWKPAPWQADQIHVWPSQHQANSGTYLIPTAKTSHVNREHSIMSRTKSVAILGIDHGEGFDNIPTTAHTRYISDYLGTMRRLLSKVTDEYVWVISSVCDYGHFDFTWHPSEWQQGMLHVFASNEQKFGDTFYVHVPSFMAKTENLKVLEWFETLHFVEDIAVPRKPMPQIKYTTDSVVPAVWDHVFQTPLVQFYHNDSATQIPTVALWQEITKTVVPLSAGNTAVIVPRECKNYLKTQLYDYPYINKSHNIHSEPAMDVVFISNGESMAEQNWNQLRSQCSRAKRSDGVTGREAAYKAAAAISTTPWFFAVFAKTEVLPDFKFDYQPDRMQQPKHYIFHSRNPLNGLEYGAMNINLYNRQLVLDTVPGLDFTLSAAHDVVPICASISRFNTDPWITWRSAFREVLKLQREVDLGADVEIEYRLRTWKTVAVGENSSWCLQGSQDAAEFYDLVKGDYEQLRLSFDWAWLQDYYYSRYHTRPWLELV